MSSSTVIKLRQVLSEKFPNIRGHGLQSADYLSKFWRTGLPQIDIQCASFPESGITELVAENRHCGSATLISALIRCAADDNTIITLIDSADSLDVTQINEAASNKLLWVRCRSVDQAMKAADTPVVSDRILPAIPPFDRRDSLPQDTRPDPKKWLHARITSPNISTARVSGRAVQPHSF